MPLSHCKKDLFYRAFAKKDEDAMLEIAEIASLGAPRRQLPEEEVEALWGGEASTPQIGAYAIGCDADGTYRLIDEEGIEYSSFLPFLAVSEVVRAFVCSDDVGVAAFDSLFTHFDALLCGKIPEDWRKDAASQMADFLLGGGA
jgi:hypothetical protein